MNVAIQPLDGLCSVGGGCVEPLPSRRSPGRSSGRLGAVMPKFVTIEDLRRAAKWNMPKPMFDYVDGGANAEWTMHENRAGFERITFDPRVLVDVSERDMSTTVFGEKLKVPIIVAPTGMTSIAWPRGEILAARAAGRAGAGLALSTYGTSAIEDVAAAGPGPFWFQLYVSKDRDKTDELVDRAQAAGFK